MTTQHGFSCQTISMLFTRYSDVSLCVTKLQLKFYCCKISYILPFDGHGGRVGPYSGVIWLLPPKFHPSIIVNMCDYNFNEN